ncbi:TPA: phage major capsid protein, P2 family [Klebsiella pneumoniae]|nr:phage major capsid protein, P2 family [Klebsiella pneumoniae]HDY4998482.1 phage major capsid protein, P2 family [Klebsiella pneumoniae]
MLLNQETRDLLERFTAAMGETYGVRDPRQMFSITPPMDTQLRKAIIESNDFLQLVNMLTVNNITGQVVATGNPGLFTGRKADGRFSRKLDNSGNKYELVEVDSGAHLDYTTIVAWVNAGDEGEFFNKIQAFVNASFAQDILRVAFNGTHAVEGDTDPVTCPNGEDVAKGWQAIVKERAPAQIITDVVTINRPRNGADFIGLDAAANDLRQTLIHPAYRNNPDLVVLAGRDLVAADTTSLLNEIDAPSEKVAAQLLNRKVAGMPLYSPPFIPDGRLTVTTLWNLHIYNQKGTGYRRADWNDDRKRFENNYLRMEGYGVEYDELYASFDHVEIPGMNDRDDNSEA